MNWLDSLSRDFGYVARSLRRSPGFTLTVVATLAVGIGINAAVFTVTDAALFAGFPLVQRNDRILYITTTKDAVYYPDFEDWRAQAKSFEGMALVRNVFATLSDDSGGLDSYFTTEVTPNTFSLLGVRPILGRDFLPSDQQPGAEPVAMLRYDLWERRFGRNPAIVGQSVRINGIATTVIGVMPRGFSFPTDQDLWTPLVPTPAAQRREISYARYAFARMADGVTIENARAEMETIGQRLASAYPETNRGVAPVLRTFEEWSIGAKGSLLYQATWGAVGFVLLIVCGNMANLLLERALGRSREVAVRLALGAGQRRILRQFLLESSILASLAGVVGWWIARVTVHAYVLAQASGDVARVLSYTMDNRVLAYLVAISVGAGLVVGLLAAAGLAKIDVNNALKDGKSGIAGGRRGTRLSNLLVASQMALAVVLLTSAGLMIRSFLNVSTADVGVDTKNVLSMSLYVPDERYPDSEAQISFYQELRRRLQTLPGVESVGFGTAAPADFAPRFAYELADAPAVDERSRPTVSRFVVGTSYFRTLAARVIAGRDLDDSDRPSTTPVAVVNELFASENWPEQNPLGKRLRLFPGSEGTPWLTVVGVVSNIVQNDRTRQEFEPLVYVPYAQGPQRNMFAFARTAVAPESLITAFRREVYAMDPDLPVPALWPLAERFDRSYSFERNITVLFLAFAAVALLLASVGLYATVSRSVSHRTQEIGVRTALGATGRDIRILVLRNAAVPLGLGLVVGLAASFAINRVLESQLVHVSPGDPATFVLASVVLVVSALAGCVIPARRALRVDPIIALRHE